MRRKVDPVTVNVLITGCAGNQAHFIWSALKRSSLSLRIIGCNYDHLGAGLYQFDAGYVVPPASDPGYLPEIATLCRNEDVHIIMAGNMAEMRALAANKDRLYEQTGAFVVTSPIDVLRRTEDKLAAARYLAQLGFDSPRSVLPDERKELQRFLDEVPFPVIVKDRFGAGSQGVAPAHNRAQLNYLLNSIPNAVIQEYLWPDDEEYTVGVFLSSQSTPVASIVMKRQLRQGTADVTPGMDDKVREEPGKRLATQVGPMIFAAVPGPREPVRVLISDQGPPNEILVTQFSKAAPVQDVGRIRADRPRTALVRFSDERRRSGRTVEDASC